MCVCVCGVREECGEREYECGCGVRGMSVCVWCVVCVWWEECGVCVCVCVCEREYGVCVCVCVCV